VADRSKAWVCARSPAEIVGSNAAGDMDVFLLWVVCVVRLVTRPGESCRLRCVVMCELGASKCGDHGPSWVKAQKTKQNKTETKPKHNCPYIYNKLKKCINRKYMNTVLFATVPTILVRSPKFYSLYVSIRCYWQTLSRHTNGHTHTHIHSPVICFQVHTHCYT